MQTTDASTEPQERTDAKNTNAFMSKTWFYGLHWFQGIRKDEELHVSLNIGKTTSTVVLFSFRLFGFLRKIAAKNEKKSCVGTPRLLDREIHSDFRSCPYYIWNFRPGSVLVRSVPRTDQITEGLTLHQAVDAPLGPDERGDQERGRDRSRHGRTRASKA